MSLELNIIGILKNQHLNVTGFNTIQSCLKSIYSVDQTDNQLKKIMHHFLMQQDLITEYGAVYFYHVPTEFEDEDESFTNNELAQHIIFKYTKHIIAITEEIAADAVINFCMRNAEDKETLRPLYNQIREKYDIAYPNVY